MMSLETLQTLVRDTNDLLNKVDLSISLSVDQDTHHHFIELLEEADSDLRNLRAKINHIIGLAQAPKKRVHPYEFELEDKDNPCHCCHCVARRHRKEAELLNTSIWFGKKLGDDHAE